MPNENCLFCKIVNKEIPAHVIYEDEHALGFLDIHPRAYGHTLVIPKVHAANICDLPEPEMGPLLLAVKKVSELLLAKIEAPGLTIGINQGEVSGQEVAHLHVHVMPRFPADGGGAIQSVMRYSPLKSVEEAEKQILGE